MLARLLHSPVLLVLTAIVAIFALYETSVRFFAYTADAYVLSNVVVLSAEVPGPISELSVQDNQIVAAGDLLFRIDRRPFELKVEGDTAALTQARANLALAKDELAASAAGIASAEAVATNARDAFKRVQRLSSDGFASVAALDVARRDIDTALAAADIARAQQSVAAQRVAVATASISVAEAALNRARYDLSRTVVTAPDAGRVAPFVARVGDYLQPGTAVLALVTGDRRRVVANLNERHLARTRVGQTVWLMLGSDPWRLHRGRVSGISPGIARTDADQPVLPYVEPTTDWVRLPRRFPVEVILDDWPDELGLFVGADARVLVWF
ncbi:HlyD family secretion protein [Segnochrobactraceae bacterium EtOH-i3]